MATKTVKRIKLTNNKASQVEALTPKKAAPVSTPEPNQPEPKKNPLNFIAAPFVGTWRYFKGSWQELQQVRWPNRKATWGLTLAVILFTAFFVIIIVALDSAFQYLFKEVLLK